MRPHKRTISSRTRATRDLIIIVLLAVGAFIVAVALEAFEAIFYWSQQYEDYEVDELLTVGFILPVAFGVYAWRRWRDETSALDEKDVAITRLNESIRQKEILLKEVHHRTKNSLAIAASLIRISASDGMGERELSEIATRIDVIAEVHRYLQDSASYDLVDLHGYLGRVVAGSMGHASGVEVRNEVEHLEVPTKTAVTLGLIVNELVSNALKHGFNDVDPKMFAWKAYTDQQTPVLTV